MKAIATVKDKRTIIGLSTKTKIVNSYDEAKEWAIGLKNLARPCFAVLDKGHCITIYLNPLKFLYGDTKD